MTLDDLRRQPALKAQVAWLERVQAALLAADDCLGAAVGGSLADGRGDALSDIDLLVYARAGRTEALLQRLAAEAADGPVRHRLRGRHDDRSLYEKVVLDSGLSYEIHVIDPGTRMRLRWPFITLVDRAGTLAARRDDTKPIGRDTLRPLAAGREGLAWELHNALKWLQRGEIDDTVRYLQRLGRALEAAEATPAPQTPNAQTPTPQTPAPREARAVASAPGEALPMATGPASASPSDPDLLLGYAAMDIAAVHAFLTTTYWSPGVPYEVVDRAARHSLCAGLRADGQQVAYARAVTDHATFAYLADVYVLPAYRGRGWSRRLLDALFAQPELQGLRRFLLATRDAHGLYARYGFTPLNAPDRLMERHRPSVYAAPGTPPSPQPELTMTATCACGQTTITVNAGPTMLGVCHCTNCKRRTGSAFGVSAYFDRSAVVSQTGATQTYAFHHAAQRHEQERHFCARCGTTLFWFVSTLPEQIGIAGGCFAEQGLPEPDYSVTHQKREPWVTLPAGWKTHVG